MPTQTLHPEASSALEQSLQDPTKPQAQESRLRMAVRTWASRLRPTIGQERRENVRYPFPLLLRLTPVDAKTMQPVAEAQVVVGKSLCEQGIGFFHQQPLPYRYAIITAEDEKLSEYQLLVDMAWCRYTRFGWYESGGRLLRTVEAEESILTGGDSDSEDLVHEDPTWTDSSQES